MKTDPEELERRKKERAAADRAWLKENGFCTHCKKEYAEPGKTLCLQCKIENRERRSRYVREHPDRYRETELKHREKKKEQRKLWAESGLCISCGKRQAEKGKKRCAGCLAKDRKYHKKAYDKTHEPKAWWECRFCHKRATASPEMCEEHYAKAVAAARKAASMVDRTKERARVAALWEGMKYDAGKAGKK